MMSKNSFWASLRENNRRRVWLWLVSWLFWFLYYPVGMMMIMGRKQNHNLIDNLTPDKAKERLLEAANEWLSFQGMFYFIIIAMAVIIAIQGFSYLYKRQKVDFYHSVPVKKSRRFAVIYLNGVLIFFVPYLFNLLLAMAVAGMNGAMDGNNAAAAMLSLAVSLTLFLGTYGLTLVAVMMTGNLIITLLATGIFLVYEEAVRILVIAYRSAFYRYNLNISMEETHFCTSPAFQMFLYENQEQGNMGALFMVIILAAVYTGIAWFCYKKRPAEAAGRAMAFSQTKAPVKILLVIPFALAAALLIMDVVGDMPYGMMVFGMVLAVVLGSCVIEVIYEMDIRAAFRKKYQMLVSGAGVAVIFLIYCFDLTGFDAWTPNPEKLEDAVVLFESDQYRSSYMDDNLESVRMADYFLGRKGIADIETVCELSEKKQAEGNVWCTVAYRMKNGKVVWRKFAVDSGEEELLNRIIGSREHREAVCQLYDDAIYAKIKGEKIVDFTFDTGFKEINLSLGDMDGFREAYLKDREKLDYSTLKNEFICGQISFRVDMGMSEDGREIFSRNFCYDIYPSYSNTLAFLKEKGGYDGTYFNMDEVEYVEVTNYNSEMYYKGTDAEVNLQRGSGSYSVTKQFAEKGQIEELLQAVYPEEFESLWKEPGTINYDYRVTVRYKSGESGTIFYRGGHFIRDRIPEWVKRETAYQ